MNIGIIGCGAIGSSLAKAAEDFKEIEEIFLFDKSHVCSRVLEEKFSKVKSILEFEELLEKSDFIIEAASQEAVTLFVERILKAKKDVLIMSIGALVDDSLRERLRKAALENRCRIFLPTGALCGVDGLSSAAVEGISEVTLITTKPPSALADADYVKEEGIDLKNLSEPTTIFAGSAKEAVKLFPRNVNVAATVSLAGIGFDRTKVRIIADPKTDMNHHKIIAKGKFGSMSAEMNNVPFERNPKTSKIAAQSAIAAMKKIVGTYWVGV
jgi:aspartate dehydrogenase